MNEEQTLGFAQAVLETLPMTNPVAYTLLRLKLASDPQLAHDAEAFFQPSRYPRAVIASRDTVSSAQLQLEIQTAMQSWSRAVQMASNIMKSLHDMQMTIINNTR
jgi:type III secretion apparatus needle protein